VQAQRDAFELPSTVRLLDLHAGGVGAAAGSCANDFQSKIE
jgi:hypothetical protein